MAKRMKAGPLDESLIIQSFKDATADMYKLPEVAELVDPSLTEAVMAKVAEFNANK